MMIIFFIRRRRNPRFKRKDTLFPYTTLFRSVLLVIAAFLGRELGVAELAFDWPRWDIAARCAIVALTASTAHYLIYHGTSRAGAAQIAPATYVQMLVATVIGWAFFGDMPDAATILGAAIKIGRASCRERVCKYG